MKKEKEKLKLKPNKLPCVHRSLCIFAAKISPPLVKLNTSKQGIVVQVKAPRVLVRKMHNSVDYNVYVIHGSGKEVQNSLLNILTPFQKSVRIQNPD